MERGKTFLRDYLRRAIRAGAYGTVAPLKLESGLQLELHVDDLIDREILINGIWQPALVRLIRNRLKPGGIFIDVGANIGYMSLLAAQAVGPTGHVLALEPNPDTFRRLQRNIALSKAAQVRCIQVAAGAGKGTATLFDESRGNSGGASIRPSKATEGIEVEVVALDDCYADLGWPLPDLIKIDVEGAEYAALQGMRQMLSRPNGPNVICEISEWSLLQQVMRFMEECGYVWEALAKPEISALSGASRMVQFDAYFSKAHR